MRLTGYKYQVDTLPDDCQVPQIRGGKSWKQDPEPRLGINSDSDPIRTAWSDL